MRIADQQHDAVASLVKHGKGLKAMGKRFVVQDARFRLPGCMRRWHGHAKGAWQHLRRPKNSAAPLGQAISRQIQQHAPSIALRDQDHVGASKNAIQQEAKRVRLVHRLDWARYVHGSCCLRCVVTACGRMLYALKGFKIDPAGVSPALAPGSAAWLQIHAADRHSRCSWLCPPCNNGGQMRGQSGARMTTGQLIGVVTARKWLPYQPDDY